MSVTLREMTGRHIGPLNDVFHLCDEAEDRGDRLSEEDRGRCVEWLDEAHTAGRNLEAWGDYDRTDWSSYEMAQRALARVAPEVEPPSLDSIFPEVSPAKKSWLGLNGLVRFQKSCRMQTRGYSAEPNAATRLARMIFDHGQSETKIAVHEAGHSLLVHAYGGALKNAEFCPDDKTAAIVRYSNSKDFTPRQSIAVSLAGKASEREALMNCPILREVVSDYSGARSDFKAADEIETSFRAEHGGEAATQLRRDAWDVATSTVRLGFERVLDVAEKFLEESYLDGPELRKALGAEE